MHVHTSFLFSYDRYTELQTLVESIFFFLEVLVSHIANTVDNNNRCM